MRTALFLVAGLLLLAVFLILGKLFSANYPNATLFATGAFVVVWLLVASFNMWVGVTKAGYSVGEELPVLLLIFAVPAILAVILKWRVM